ncbi:MAG TPA: class I SAM-dependent methyltransferase [Ktedonosporobacter sp.]|jgi:2-polyprenyl-3-methyl-5-hydroxy-6-metoxy-1,4-benzoquinol methylase|nr:class I SAM-dependent methyltransferase [Ktedonosporobacter sp.]
MSEITNAEAIKQWSNVPQELAENFGDEGDFTRRYLLNPAIFALLGDVTGKAILDAGCGQGYLARKGAIVTGVEPAEKFYAYAAQKEQEERSGINYIQEDLSAFTTLTESFDYVIANMVLMDIPDYVTALRNCVAALKKGGGLLISLLHPCFEESGSAWADKGYVEVRDYFRERTVPQHYAPFVHRPLSTYLNAIIQAGCMLQQVIEPQLDKEIARHHQRERYHYVPGYVVIYATKLLL